MEQQPAKIRINTKGSALPRNWKVFLNDQDISHFVCGLDIHAPVSGRAVVTLQVIGNLDLPDELQAYVLAEAGQA